MSSPRSPNSPASPSSPRRHGNDTARTKYLYIAILVVTAFLFGNIVYLVSLASLHASPLSHVLLKLGTMVITACCMEYYTRWQHRVLWHGCVQWWIHGSHHQRRPNFGQAPEESVNELPEERTAIEFEDIAPLMYVIPSVGLLILTTADPTTSPLHYDVLWGLATGMALYGFMYLCGHDGIYHGRLGPALPGFFRNGHNDWFPLWERFRKHMIAASNAHASHHVVDQGGERPGVDLKPEPFGPPYGFWLGAAELKNAKAGLSPPPMSMFMKIATFVLVGSVAASVVLACTGQ
eukprot:TRINITY_DN501_c0_g1_i1.p1 TRINITY_DN501_c0_g1~~TRINITY_DN501_c0_g1_i1.p1  ORF type:complete len:292 (+),score=22.53 TRINITY_DN501_c0_g1_i1:209-1084(+)